MNKLRVIALFVSASTFSGVGLCQQYAIQFNAPDRVVGEPGSTVRVQVSVEVVASQPDNTRFSLSVDIRGENATVGADPCDAACAASLIFQGGEVGQLAFWLLRVVDPGRILDSGPLAGAPQGEGLIAVAFYDGGCSPDSLALPLGTSTVLRFYIDVIVPEDETQVDLSFLDGKAGTGNPVENILIGRDLGGVSCETLEFARVSRSFTVYGRPSCPEAGDTHCTVLAVEPAGGPAGRFTATAEARDESEDSILYTFEATNGVDPEIIVGPQAESSAVLELSPGTWTVTVRVDDDPDCPDEAEDAICSAVELVVSELVGPFLRGDCDNDGFVGGSVTDPVFYLNWAFSGGPEPQCVAACDADADGFVGGSVTDPVYYLNWAFSGGPPPSAPFPQCGPGTAADEDLGCETPSKACPG